MIQDLGAHRLDNRYDPDCTPQTQDAVIAYRNQTVLIGEEYTKGALRFPSVREYGNTDGLIYLFSIEDRAFFLSDRIMDLDGFEAVGMRALRSGPMEPRDHVFAAFTAMHLAEWYRRKRFCGACGKPLTHDPKERAMLCPSCGEKYYPRINPAVIVGVINGDRLLITQYNYGAGFNALVAGFTEIGETLEETVSREVLEETGIRVKNIRYYKSQPWGIASDILAGFYCEVDGDDTIHTDHSELRIAHWVPREEILLQPTDYSLTNEMMRMFKEGKIK